jgi:hypothetical protein
MHDGGVEEEMRRSSSGLGWFLLGTLLGAVLSSGAVVVATEFQYRRRLRRFRRVNGELADDFEHNLDIVDSLSQVVSEGLGVMADAVARIGESFSGQRRETIRYDLGMAGAGGHGASSHGWYLGDDDEYAEAHPPDPQLAVPVEYQPEVGSGDDPPLPS